MAPKRPVDAVTGEDPLAKKGKNEEEAAKMDEEPKEDPEKEKDAPEDKRPKIKSTIGFDTQDTTMNVVPTTGSEVLMALTEGGMQYLIAGARANAGVKSGRYLYEVKVVEAIAIADFNQNQWNQPTNVPHPKQLVRVGFSVAGSELLLGDSPAGVCFDSEGNFWNERRRSPVSQKFGRDTIVGLLLNLDAKSPNANTVSMFLNGRRVCEPQALPEAMKGQTLFPHVAFRNVSLQVHFGPAPLNTLPFKCTCLQNAAKADMEEAKAAVPKDGKYEVLFPVCFPDEGSFEWLDEFLKEKPEYCELSDRKIQDWAVKSGFWKPRQGWKSSGDRPEFNFQVPAMDDSSVRRAIYNWATVVPRNFVVMEIKENLLEADRAVNLKKFSGPQYKKIAQVVMGEPPEDFKEKNYKLLLEQKQAKAEIEWARKAKEREMQKLQREMQKKRQDEIAKRKADAEAKVKEEQAQAEAEVKAEDGDLNSEILKKAAEFAETGGVISLPEAKELCQMGEPFGILVGAAKTAMQQLLKENKFSAKAEPFVEAQTASSEVSSYYKTIDKVKYDKTLLDLAEQGQIDVKEAEALWEEAKDGKGVTETGKRTLAYSLDTHKYTEKAAEFMKEKLGPLPEKEKKAEVKEEEKDDPMEGKKEEEEEEEEKECPKVELTDEEKKQFFKKPLMPDIAPTLMASVFGSFTVPKKEEGFDEIRYTWANEAKSREYLSKWVLDRKISSRIDDLVPGEWFTTTLANFNTSMKEWQEKQKTYKPKEEEKKPEEKEGEGEGAEEGEKKDEDMEEKKDEKVEDIDIFTLEDVTDIGNGEPLFAHFEFEDWALCSLRCELWLVVASYKKDANDPARIGIHETNLSFYVSKYLKKQINPRLYGKENMRDLLVLIKDTIKIDDDNGVLMSQLTEDADSAGAFIKLTEKTRRERQLRMDAGDETVRLNFAMLKQQDEAPLAQTTPDWQNKGKGGWSQGGNQGGWNRQQGGGGGGN